MLLENGLLAVLEALKTLENRSRSQIIERLIIFFIETQKGQSDETAWKKSQRAYKRTLINQAQKNKLKRKQLERIRKNQKKNKTSLTQIVRLAILKGLKQFEKNNLLVHLTLKEFNSFLEVLEEKNRKKH